ncbi:polysaccharide deacetylase [Candidatus Saccharibacteria bacterium]|nr:polysaccharide deacetylase [Candidatus Saccharibacteria bacterium]
MEKPKRRSNKLRIILVYICYFALTLNIFLAIANIVVNTDYYLSKVLLPLPVDDTPPTIQLRGPEHVTIAVGSTYVDEGVTAYDIRSETTVETNGSVDTTAIGEYKIEYVATDEHDNSSAASRTVSVVQPTGVIYLTFDDGPGAYTSYLLDVLKKYNVLATFFVTGSGDDALIKREYDEGHTVALHSYSHNYSYIYSSVDNFYADLFAIRDRVKNITGQTSNLMRFPGGSSNTVSTRYDGKSHIMSYLTQDVGKQGFYYFDWNVNSGDAGGATTSDEVYNRVVNGLKVGEDSVVLQHDIKGFSVDAVERIIQYGLNNGFIFSKLSATSYPAHHGVNN